MPAVTHSKQADRRRCWGLRAEGSAAAREGRRSVGDRSEPRAACRRELIEARLDEVLVEGSVNGMSVMDDRASIAAIKELVDTINARRESGIAGVADDLLMTGLTPSVDGRIVGMPERERALMER